ncbi:hypothetical protein FD755_001791, partial [Muntiacus reevesi]
MATAQLQRTSMVCALIFPNKISTEQQSLVLVKRLLAVSVSCITYLRGIFPECAYGTRYLDVQNSLILGLFTTISFKAFHHHKRKP